MPKALCIAAMVIAALVLLLFLADFVLNMVSQTSIAPFKGASPLMDIMFILCALGLGFLSWSTFKEQI